VYNYVLHRTQSNVLKVIPYKNGVGIKKIIFLDSGKKCCLPFDHTNDQKDSHHPSLIKGGI
jgi:hypothetical protein